MDTTIKRIGIGYENCDMFYVNSEHLILILMSEITTGFFMKKDAKFTRFKIAGETYLVIHRDADNLTEMEKPVSKEKAFQRTVRWNDITDIKIEYADGTEEFIDVAYETIDPDKDGPNIYQTSCLNANNHLLIAISKDPKRRDEFIRSWTSEPKEGSY